MSTTQSFSDNLASQYENLFLDWNATTQAYETAKYFCEKLGFRRIGAFLPPEQDADERMYLKELKP